jgi:hypothetical protein
MHPIRRVLAVAGVAPDATTVPVLVIDSTRRPARCQCFQFLTDKRCRSGDGRERRNPSDPRGSEIATDGRDSVIAKNPFIPTIRYRRHVAIGYDEYAGFSTPDGRRRGLDDNGLDGAEPSVR